MGEHDERLVPGGAGSGFCLWVGVLKSRDTTALFIFILFFLWGGWFEAYLFFAAKCCKRA